MPRKSSADKAPSNVDTLKANVAKKARKPAVKAGDEPQMTQQDAIAQAFLTLKNAGLLPVSLEAQPTENEARIAEQVKANGPQSPLPLKMLLAAAGVNLDDLKASLAGEQIKASPNEQSQTRVSPGASMMPGRPFGLFEESLSALNQLVATTHQEIASLISTLEPFLPRYMFEPSADGAECKNESDFDWRPTSGTALSATQLTLNNALNELNLARRRIIDLRTSICL